MLLIFCEAFRSPKERVSNKHDCEHDCDDCHFLLPLRVREGDMGMSLLLLTAIGAAAGCRATRLVGIEMGMPQIIAVGVTAEVPGGLAIRFCL